MTIAWNSFTPWASLAGGALIGLATAMFVLLNGRIAGVSGILAGMLRPARGDIAWRVAFLGGLILAAPAYGLLTSLPEVKIDAGYGTLVAAGLLVGLGTRYGAGCTSGHGVCGVSRRSPRSIAANAAFMATGFITVLVVRHLLAV
jgi:uncharacterized membrane protein YedE/YeeE